MRVHVYVCVCAALDKRMHVCDNDYVRAHVRVDVCVHSAELFSVLPLV